MDFRILWQKVDNSGVRPKGTSPGQIVVRIEKGGEVGS